MANTTTNAFELSMAEVIAAARGEAEQQVDAEQAAWNSVPEERVTTAMAAVAWNSVPEERVTTAMAAVAWNSVPEERVTTAMAAVAW